MDDTFWGRGTGSPASSYHSTRQFSPWSVCSISISEVQNQVGLFHHSIGGPAFLSPLYASHAVTPLLALLALSESSPQLVLQTLRTLNSIADAHSLSTPDQSRAGASLSDLLYTDDVLRNLAVLILQTSPSMITHQQINLVAVLVSKTCLEGVHRTLLVRSGVLDALAAKLAAWVAATLVYPSSGEQKQSRTWVMPDGNICLRNARLSSILHAISTILQHSPSRASHLVNTPCLSSVFQKLDTDVRAVCEKATAALLAGTKVDSISPSTFMETMLPSLPMSQYRPALEHPMGFPPLDPIKVQGKQSQWPRCISSAVEIFSGTGLEHVSEDESPLVSWLMHVSRVFDEVTSLTAVRLLATLYGLGLVKKSRDSAIALLVVPPLVHMLDKDLKISQNCLHPFDNSMVTPLSNIIKEEAPAVLAMLAVNNPKAQKAAADAGAIKKLSQLLKETYESVPASSSSTLWSSQPVEPTATPTRDEISRLGATGISRSAYHSIKVRETTLVAFAALASDKDEYRKVMIDNGVITFIIRTLRAEDTFFAPPSSGVESFNYENIEQKASYAHCREAILAACGAARALSRSVSTLRTSLMDAGLTAPLFVLLRCNDMGLKVAATAVVCNLVLEFSPMREVSKVRMTYPRQQLIQA